jgi:hypothetical protein
MRTDNLVHKNRDLYVSPRTSQRALPQPNRMYMEVFSNHFHKDNLLHSSGMQTYSKMNMFVYFNTTTHSKLLLHKTL